MHRLLERYGSVAFGFSAIFHWVLTACTNLYMPLKTNSLLNKTKHFQVKSFPKKYILSMVFLKRFKVLYSQIRHHKWLPRFQIYPTMEVSQKENKIISYSYEKKKNTPYGTMG